MGFPQRCVRGSAPPVLRDRAAPPMSVLIGEARSWQSVRRAQKFMTGPLWPGHVSNSLAMIIAH